MATLGIEESIQKYEHYIKIMRSLADNLRSLGYKIDVQEDIEVEAIYIVTLDDKNNARLWWNAPHYLEFESYVAQSKKTFPLIM